MIKVEYATSNKLTKSNNDLKEKIISFSINGINHTVDNIYPLTMTLNDYLRDVLNLTGYLSKIYKLN